MSLKKGQSSAHGRSLGRITPQQVDLLSEYLSPAVRISDKVLGAGRSHYVQLELRESLELCRGAISRERYGIMSNLLAELEGRDAVTPAGSFKQGISGQGG